jgi:hypothetical protein
VLRGYLTEDIGDAADDCFILESRHMHPLPMFSPLSSALEHILDLGASLLGLSTHFHSHFG